MSEATFIKVQALIAAPIATVWDKWTQAEHVVNWNFAHESWCCPSASVDFKEGGSSNYRMEAKDGSFGFDLKASFLAIEPLQSISSALEDGRLVEVKFVSNGDQTLLEQRFQPESENSQELQEQGWQAILNQFKSYCEQGV
ncbi:MAG: hypothetical protein RLZZ65_138 [Bacteroidota bacterium]|jgi:uncharacterized protein YndB with AHSA1/START domain